MVMHAIDEETFFQGLEFEVGKEAREMADALEDELRKSLNPEQARMLIQLSDLRCQEMGTILDAVSKRLKAELTRCPFISK